MPTRLSQTRKGKRKLPPGGRIIEYVEPHSPFQKLIETARLRYGFTTRSLGAAIGTSQSNVWIWTHNKNGFPSPKSFKEHHLEALSQVLKIPQEEIRSAIDASRSWYRPGELPPPRPTIDAFKAFIEVLENDKRDRFARSFVINLAKVFYNGTLYAHPQGESAPEEETAKKAASKPKAKPRK